MLKCLNIPESLSQPGHSLIIWHEKYDCGTQVNLSKAATRKQTPLLTHSPGHQVDQSAVVI